ncbi:hypothetical protein VMCG_09793 [Cytospora schulzeri]|uniref:Uncharacterized protein n=1 Tax=Cytospora schulzeri TaxID=448051 RepID=A0A423VGD3_9PEZI|nr:hypothetical protein VMCG_09793 [Valsa malicola]
MAPRPIVAVLTGASRGIGRSIYDAILSSSTWRLDRPEAPVIIFATSRSGTVSKPHPSQPTLANFTLIPTRLSLTEVDTIEDLVHKVQSEYGGCDVLINNAGVYHYREDITSAERDEMLDTNFFGTVKNLASKGVANEHGWPPMTYFTSKAALNAATRILARDNPHLLINCCCPGWVDTELGGQAGRPPKTPGESKLPGYAARNGRSPGALMPCADTDDPDNVD